MNAPVLLQPKPLNWVPEPGFVLNGVLLGFCWLLAHLPPTVGFAGYMIALVCLTRWIVRHVQPTPINAGHPMFQQPGGGLVWFGTGALRLLFIIGAAVTAGLSLPQALADSLWRDPLVWTVGDRLGAMGRLSELVGLVCGGVIGWRCQHQLIVLFLVSVAGYGLTHLASWVLAG